VTSSEFPNRGERTPLPRQRSLGLGCHMRLYVEPMDAYVVEVTSDGRVTIDDAAPAAPTLQERRAILYAAKAEIEALQELVEILERQ
jgi:hypothetical protein